MTADAFTPVHRPVTLLGISLEHVRAFAVWIMMASSFFVVIEPAPCDLLFMVALVLYAATGLSFPILVAPLFFYLLIYNMGGFISFLEVSNEGKAGMFVITSAYMAVSAVFFACFVAEDPVRRMKAFTNGYVVGALLAAVIGLMGYFNFHGWAATMSPLQRVQGTFKDPNVISTYLIFPGILLVQSFMLGGQRFPLLRAGALLVIMAALFLAFSRGAWISFSAATMLMIIFTFVLTPSAPLRSRIIFLSILGAGIVAVLLIALLSIESVRSLFLDRLTLEKSYDSGEHGRFGIQANSIQYLLMSPQGFGPTLFRKLFGQDPHNVFLNAFASYGWVGGVTYLMMTVTTVALGFRTMLIRTPWQHYSIVVFCPLLTTILQGVQIDTDHWRHFYWLMGLQWGLFAASMAYAAGMRGQRSRAAV